MRGRGEARGFLYLLAAILLWSTAEVVIRAIRFDIGPVQLAFLRFALGGALLAAFLPRELRRKGLRLDARVWLHGAWLSLIGIVAASLSFQYGLIHAGAGVVAAMLGASPLFVFLLARVLLGDPLTWPRFAGVTLGFLGILLLGASPASDTFTLLGFGLATLNSFCFALFTVMVKRVGGAHQGLPMTIVCFFFGSLWLLPLALWEGGLAGFAMPPLLWLPVLYLSLGTTGLAYLFFFLGLERTDATAAMSVILLKPPVAALLAAVFLGEAITWNLAGALVCILGGLYLVRWLHRRLEAGAAANVERVQ